jgi:hypothetical protein
VEEKTGMRTYYDMDKVSPILILSSKPVLMKMRFSPVSVGLIIKHGVKLENIIVAFRSID